MLLFYHYLKITCSNQINYTFALRARKQDHNLSQTAATVATSNKSVLLTLFQWPTMVQQQTNPAQKTLCVSLCGTCMRIGVSEKQKV